MSEHSPLPMFLTILLGGRDKRVPNSQGLQLYYYLKERGVETKLNMYPKSGHAISKVDEEVSQLLLPEIFTLFSQGDHWVHVALWFQKFSQK